MKSRTQLNVATVPEIGGLAGSSGDEGQKPGAMVDLKGIAFSVSFKHHNCTRGTLLLFIFF